jgi:hypothetical protein
MHVSIARAPVHCAPVHCAVVEHMGSSHTACQHKSLIQMHSSHVQQCMKMQQACATCRAVRHQVVVLTCLISSLQEESVPVVPHQLIQGNIVLLKLLQHTAQHSTQWLLISSFRGTYWGTASQASATPHHSTAHHCKAQLARGARRTHMLCFLVALQRVCRWPTLHTLGWMQAHKLQTH